MADIDISKPTSMPGGIVTFEMIYRAIDKLLKRMDKVEEQLAKLEITPPPPILKVDAVGKDITTEKKVTK